MKTRSKTVLVLKQQIFGLLTLIACFGTIARCEVSEFTSQEPAATKPSMNLVDSQTKTIIFKLCPNSKHWQLYDNESKNVLIAQFRVFAGKPTVNDSNHMRN